MTSNTMRAAVLYEHGSRDVLQIADLPVPEPGRAAGEVEHEGGYTASSGDDCQPRLGLTFSPHFYHSRGSMITHIPQLNRHVGHDNTEFFAGDNHQKPKLPSPINIKRDGTTVFESRTCAH